MKKTTSSIIKISIIGVLLIFGIILSFCSFDFGVFFPMADYYYRAQKDVSAPIWQEYQDFQIISFSRKMHEELIANGFSSHYFQYFPEPASKFCGFCSSSTRMAIPLS